VEEMRQQTERAVLEENLAKLRKLLPAMEADNWMFEDNSTADNNNAVCSLRL